MSFYLLGFDLDQMTFVLKFDPDMIKMYLHKNNEILAPVVQML